MEKVKLPIVDTALGGMAFGWKNIGTTIRMGWLGFVLFLVVVFGSMAAVAGPDFIGNFASEIEKLEDNADVEPEFMFELIALYFAFLGAILVGSLAFLPFYVVMHRIAAGEIDPPGGLGYFKLGGREVRVIIGYIVLFFVSLAVLAVLLVPVGGMMAAGGLFSADATEEVVVANIALIMLAYLLAWVALIWINIRLITFLPAVAIENRLVFMRSFKMTGGNFWRIFVSYLLFSLIMMAVVMALEIVIFIFIGIGVAIYSSLGGGDIGQTGLILGGVAGLIFAIIVGLFIAFTSGASMAFSALVYKQLKNNAT